MAIEVRKGSAAVVAALVSQHNALLKKVASELTTQPHADVSSDTSGDFSAPVATARTCTTASLDTLAKVVTRANLLKVLFNQHFADDLAHDAADDVNVIDAPDATSSNQTTLQTEANTLLNAIQAALIAHQIESGVHFTNDVTTDVSAVPVASNLATSETLGAALTTAYNAHIQLALGVSAVQLIEA